MTQMPDPRASGQLHTEALIGAVDQLARLAGGGTLVLFTSFRAMNRVYDTLAPGFVSAGLKPMIQARQAPAAQRCLSSSLSPQQSCLRRIPSGRASTSRGTALRLVLITNCPPCRPSRSPWARQELLRIAGKSVL